MLDGKHNIYIHKGVTVRFGFDGRRTSQTHRQVKNKATGTPHGVYYYIALIGSLCLFHSGSRGIIIYIYVGLSALLVSTCRAMRRPFYRGTSSRTGSTFFIYINPELLKFLNAYYGSLYAKILHV